MNSSLSSAAPLNDLILVNSIHTYKAIDEVLSDAALQAFNRHTWYLSEELAPQGLFSSKVTLDTKQRMVTALMQNNVNATNTKRIGTGYGKLHLPMVPEENTSLEQLIGEDSWLFFKIIDMPHDFLYSPVAIWPENNQCKKFKLLVDNMQVVNDVALLIFHRNCQR